MLQSKTTCHLCKSQKGGSTASDDVISFVTCDSFDKMNATNIVQQNGGFRSTKMKHINRQKNKSYNARTIKGGDCDMTMTSSALDAYSIGPATIPTNLPSQNIGSIDYQGVQASVLAALARDIPVVGETYSRAVFPSTLVDNNIAVSMTGGSLGCMCD